MPFPSFTCGATHPFDAWVSVASVCVAALAIEAALHAFVGARQGAGGARFTLAAILAVATVVAGALTFWLALKAVMNLSTTG